MRSEALLRGELPVTIRRSPTARTIRLRVDRRTGAVILTVPRRASERKALAWAAGHQDWIRAQLDKVVQSEPLIPDSDVPLYGRPHRIVWDPAWPRTVRIEDETLRVGGPADNVEARILRWLKRHAADLLSRETREYAEKAGATVSRVGVGDPVSRWGSCSSTGAIRYSWRLILAPDWVRRATVAHEVAHRIHMNHGPRFHALVEQLFGADPKPARSWLRSDGPLLHRFGRS